MVKNWQIGVGVLLILVVGFVILISGPDPGEERYTCVSVGVTDVTVWSDVHLLLTTYAKVVHVRGTDKVKLYYTEPIPLLEWVILEEKLEDLDVHCTFTTIDGYHLRGIK